MKHSKFIAGTLVGAAVSMMIMPEIDRSTKKKIRRTSDRMKNAVIGWMK
ncbi:YtxH domain-containing protein [Clostridium tyrobutyricum]